MIRTRIAPSPTGEPHIGNIYTALLNYAYAKGHGGQFILRIEDTDRERFVSGAEQQIKEALDWLDIAPDEGPGQGGAFGPYRQSDKLEVYQQKAQELTESGYAYLCFCSSERLDAMRKEQQTKSQQPKYDRHCLSLSKDEIKKRLDNNEPYVIRLKVPDEGQTKFNDLIRGEVIFENQLIDDQILLKSDGYPTYHLAVVVDDYAMKINPIIRAEEWISSTPKQILLYQAFGWEVPQFAHTPLLRNLDGSKLSKRRNAVSVLWYKEQGFLSEALKNYLVRLGWSHPQDKEVFDYAEFIKLFDFDRVCTSAPVFDIQKLEWLNGVYIREKLSDKEYQQYFYDFIPGWIKVLPDSESRLVQLAPLFRERLKRFAEVPELINYFFADEIEIDLELLIKQAKSKEIAREMLEAVLGELTDLSQWEKPVIEKKLRSLGETRGWKNRPFFMTLRVAASGCIATPPLFDTLFVLGEEKVISRFKKVLAGLMV